MAERERAQWQVGRRANPSGKNNFDVASFK